MCNVHIDSSIKRDFFGTVMIWVLLAHVLVLRPVAAAIRNLASKYDITLTPILTGRQILLEQCLQLGPVDAASDDVVRDSRGNSRV